MDEINKLSIVIEHWIEHNHNHMAEYQKWAKKAGEMGLEQVKVEIEEAAKILSRSNHHLERALEPIKNW